MMKFLFPILIIFFSAISCNPVGETVSEEKPLDNQLVNTVKNLDLKEGDELVIWGKMDASFLKNDNVPIFELRYNLSLEGKTIDNKTVPMFAHEDKIINSTYEIQKEEEKDEEEETVNEPAENSEIPTESTEEKPEKTVKSNWSFEQEIIRIPITKDGKYTLDYKAGSSDEAADSMFTKVSVILRKK